MQMILAVLGLVLFRTVRQDYVAKRLNRQLSSSADIYMSLCDLDLVNNSVTEIKNVNPMISKAVNTAVSNSPHRYFPL